MLTQRQTHKPSIPNHCNMKTLAILFTLSPLMMQAGTLSLAWLENPAEEKIISYQVNYGATPSLGESLTATGATATTPDLAPGVWYFSILAINEHGDKSPASPVITGTSLVAPTTPKMFRVVLTMKGTATVTPIP